MAEAKAKETDEATEDGLDEALRRALRGESSAITTHLHCVKRDLAVGETRTKLHCYFVPLDTHSRPRLKLLAEFLRERIIDYAIPRRTISAAYEKAGSTKSMAPISRLHERAKSLFSHLANTGEGGELLVFAMAEAVFGITQIICKMALKTSTSMHYHGSDGVYAEARPDGGLNLYWGESKIYTDATDAIRVCLASLAPFLRDPDGQDSERAQDVLLINEFANFSDERIVAALKRYLDPDDPKSFQLHHCGIALAGFDSSAYPAEGVESTTDAVAAAITAELEKWTASTNNRINAEKLGSFDIHFICVPLPSAMEFRRYFLECLGVAVDD